MDFENIYSNTPDSLKLKFLDAIITYNNPLREEFMTFLRRRNNKESELPFNKFLEIIRETQTSYKERFERIDPENPDWDNYHPPFSGYIKEWEAYQYATEQEFENIFSEFSAEAVNKIISQNPGELMAMLIGLYEATQDAEVSDIDGSFEDMSEYLVSEHTNTMTELIEKLRLSAISGHVILTSFELFFRYCADEYPGNSYFPGYFEHFLVSLAEKTDNADRLLYMLDQSAVERKHLPELVLILNKKTGNTTGWLQSAIQFYHNNKEVAKQLLDYYFKSDEDAFLEIARELFPEDKEVWAEFLQQYVTPKNDKELFVKVFWQLTVRLKEIGYYNKIKEYLSETDLNNLIKELEWDKVFVIKILEINERFGDIKALVEQSADDRNYTEMITPILTVYPEFCFRHIQKKVVNTLQNRRGRHIYERIAAWLGLTFGIPGFENEKRALIQQIYNHKPNLPALKDEMRQAGLMK